MEKYLDSFGKIMQAHDQQQFDRALELSLAAIQEIPDLVKETIEEYGEWNVKSLPALEYALSYLPVLRLRDDLHMIQDLLMPVPELMDWVSDVDYALELADVMDKIESLIKNNPGLLQADLAKQFDIDSREVNKMLYHAEQLGIVKREKCEVSYRLFLNQPV